jgi:hypothetical protein
MTPLSSAAFSASTNSGLSKIVTLPNTESLNASMRDGRDIPKAIVTAAASNNDMSILVHRIFLAAASRSDSSLLFIDCTFLEK